MAIEAAHHPLKYALISAPIQNIHIYAVHPIFAKFCIWQIKNLFEICKIRAGEEKRCGRGGLKQIFG